MKYDLLVFSTESLDSHPSVGLMFPDKLYIFNVPDQTQRVFFETKIRFAKLSHVFLTTLNARSIGGFHGLTITAFDNKNNILNYSAFSAFSQILETYSHLHTQDKLRPKLIENFNDNNIIVTEHKLNDSLAFEVKLPDIPGKFLANKAKELGLKPGPIFKDLANGKTIKTPEGKTITPDQVLGPPTPGDVLFIVDCQTMADVEKLPNCKNFDFVVHFTKIDILLTSEYLSKFDSSQKALCFSPNGRITFPSVTNLYSASSSFAPTLINPIVSFDQIQNYDIPSQFVNAVPALEYAFAPPDKKKFTIPPLNNITSTAQKITITKFETFAVTFMGTGAMFPSKYRNVAGILLHTESGFIILDAGEGFTGQLRRKFGIDNFEYILKRLICVWISHLHGDHHFGLYQLLQARAQLCDSPVPLICHQYISDHIECLQKCSKTDLKFTLHSQTEKFVCGNVSIDSIPVLHCFDSYGCLVTLDGGWKVAYSGDKTFGDNFIENVGSCDLLIHEASFTDDLIDIAKDKRHSTIGQAIETGKLTHAKYVILTHFSQRYPKLPVFGTDYENVAFAFDYLSVPFERMNELCSVCPQIFQMIQDLEAKDDEKDE
ncbi:metallo-beta-lactamase superfamily protein [Tritrichomonas foetus]|uniref:ribonuclease Z n=1 Tax=Tritrichomonas foetus TaxID=1144522 RepID=A0A1J4KJ77_9EUKA|nr:metallo-beta-lactamase superfamily protein [Tritrichomonas foetus]|eukprot:OHT09389.1 metallo-beta-lactamase superfamily protein [Tritrichomonas foetus]